MDIFFPFYFSSCAGAGARPRLHPCCGCFQAACRSRCQPHSSPHTSQQRDTSRGTPQEEVPWPQPAGDSQARGILRPGGSPQTWRSWHSSGPVLNWSDVLQQCLAICVSSCGSSRREIIRQLFLRYGCEHFHLKRGLAHGSAHCTKDMVGVSGGLASLR